MIVLGQSEKALTRREQRKKRKEIFWTGVNDKVEHILGQGLVRGQETPRITRKVLLCEGESPSEYRPGEDKTLLEKVAKSEAGWQVYDCGNKQAVRQVYNKLLEKGPWGELLAVVDLDEPSKEKTLPDSFLVWPGARDLECFLLGSEAWPRVLRTVLNRKVDLKIQPPLPPYDSEGSKLPEQFAIDESACAHAWGLHTANNGKIVKYPHTKDKVHPKHFEFLSPKSPVRPRKIPSELNQLISTIIEIPDDYEELPDNFKILEADERRLSMQGKRAMSLLAARILSETYLKKDELNITKKELSRLKRSLNQTKQSTRLVSLILDYVTEEEMRGHFPELA